mgnify:CR=1 FL=1
MIRTNRANCAKSCLDMFDGAIISEIWYHEQVLIIEGFFPNLVDFNAIH